LAVIAAAALGLNVIVGYILETSGVNINSHTDFDSAGYSQVGTTALHSAANHNRIDTVNYLINKGAAVDAFDNNGRTPLMLAASHGYYDLCKALTTSGASLDLQTFFGFSALHFAAMVHCSEVVDLLLSLGATVDLVDQRGWSPLTVALNSAHTSHLSHSFQLSEASGAAAAEMRGAIAMRLIRVRPTMARLILAGADCSQISARAATLGFDEISRWVTVFSQNL
jgi:ankyrin repeat protein